MTEKYYLRGFADKSKEAVLVYLEGGIHIVNGTTQIFWDKIFSGQYETPFVLETSDGDMAAGGVTESLDSTASAPHFGAN